MDFIKGIPKLSSSISYNTLSLTPTEGYFLSRIDGVSSVEEIASLSGLPYDQAIGVIKSLWNKKVFAVEGVEQSAGEENDVDLNEDERYAIEKMAKTTENGTYYQILSLPFDVKPEQVKVRFFELSKSFHPDKYFRKNIGRYKDMLTMIFKKMSEAYEVLYDPQKKRWYDSELRKPKPSEPSAAQKPPAPKINTTAEVIEVKSVQKRQAQEETNKSRNDIDSTEETQAYEDEDNISESVSTEETVEFEKPESVDSIIEQKIALIKENLDKNMLDQALKEMDIVKNIKDVRIPLLMANYYLKENDLLSAKDYARTAVEYDEKNIKAYEILGSIYMKFKLYRNALKVYETIIKVTPDNIYAVKMIKEIKLLIED